MIRIPKPKTALAIMMITILSLYGYGCHLIFTSVKQRTRDAQAVYGGEPVAALIMLAGDAEAPFEQRNGAIWALGQIGDTRALPVLEQLRTGETQSTPYDSSAYIVQYSVEKAIRQINGISVTRWMYRRFD